MIQGHLKENTELVDELNNDMIDVRQGSVASSGGEYEGLFFSKLNQWDPFTKPNSRQASKHPWRTT